MGVVILANVFSADLVYVIRDVKYTRSMLVYARTAVGGGRENGENGVVGVVRTRRFGALLRVNGQNRRSSSDSGPACCLRSGALLGAAGAPIVRGGQGAATECRRRRPFGPRRGRPTAFSDSLALRRHKDAFVPAERRQIAPTVPADRRRHVPVPSIAV